MHIYGMKEEFFNIKFNYSEYEREYKSTKFLKSEKKHFLIWDLENDTIYFYDFVDSFENTLWRQYKKIDYEKINVII